MTKENERNGESENECSVIRVNKTSNEGPNLCSANFGATKIEVEVHRVGEGNSEIATPNRNQMLTGSLNKNSSGTLVELRGTEAPANKGESSKEKLPAVVSKVGTSYDTGSSASNMDNFNLGPTLGEAARREAKTNGAIREDPLEEITEEENEDNSEMEADNADEDGETTEEETTTGDNGHNEVIEMETENLADDEVKQEVTIIMKFKEEDKHILRCPMLYDELENSDFKHLEIKDIKANHIRGLVKLIMGSEQDALKAIEIRKLKNLEIECRKQRSSSGNYGVIGKITCPTMREAMLRKIDFYKNSLQESNTPVKSIEWIKKKVWKRGERGHTTQNSVYLKLEFINEVPEAVFIGRIRYPVEAYTAEPTQCYKCLRFGHIADDCRSDVKCMHCGTSGHKKNDNVCASRPKRCANCEGPHPATYRGCIAFLREKEAQKIRAKEKKPLHDARKIARYKDFPQLNRNVGRGLPQAPPVEENRDYAAAARNQQERTRREAETTQTPSSQPSPSTTITQEVDNAQIHQNQQGSCSCKHAEFNLKEIEASVSKMIKKAISKLLKGLAGLVINLAYMSKELGTMGSRNHLEEAMANTLGEVLQSDSSDSEEDEEDEEDEESMDEDTAGAASISAATSKAHRQKQGAIRKSFLKTKSTQEKRPAKARKKRGKRRNK